MINFSLIALIIVAAILPYCYFGTKLMWTFSKCSQRVYDCSWYKLPVKQQADLHFLLLYTQRPRCIKAYGLVECSLNVFLAVCIKAMEVYVQIIEFAFSVDPNGIFIQFADCQVI